MMGAGPCSRPGTSQNRRVPDACTSDQPHAGGSYQGRFLRTAYHGKVPKIQILTIAELFAGKKRQIPFIDQATFRRARPEEPARQGRLF